MRYNILILVLLTFAFSTADAKRNTPFDRSAYYSYGTKFYVEAHESPNLNEDSINVDILFKVVNEILVYKKDGKGKYFSAPRVEITCRDEDGVIRKRMEWSDTVYVNTYAETSSKFDFKHGHKSIVLANEKYSITIKTDDENIKETFEEKIDLLVSHNYYKASVYSTPIFCHSKAVDSNQYLPMVLGNNASFESQGTKIIIPISYFDKNDQFYYKFKKNASKSKSKDWGKRVEFTGQPEIKKDFYVDFIHNKNDQPIVNQKSGFKYPPNHSFEFDTRVGLLTIDIGSSYLYPGDYTLSIFQESSRDSLNFEFKVKWEAEPLSFKNIDYAVGSTKYILSDDEHELINEGQDKDKFIKLIRYWEKQDPTPKTPFNEAMAEYYRRVDFAFFNYQTIAARDGSKTERGKLYILFGTPTEVDESLNNGRTMETWTYQQQKKEYVFEMIKVGDYRIIEIKDIK